MPSHAVLPLVVLAAAAPQGVPSMELGEVLAGEGLGGRLRAGDLDAQLNVAQIYDAACLDLMASL